MKYELKALTIGGMIGKSFNIYINNFIPLLIISLVTSIPLLIYQLGFLSTVKEFIINPSQNNVFQYYIYYFVSIIITAALTALNTGLVIEIISRKYLGENMPISKYVKNTLPRIVPLIFAVFLVGILTSLGFVLLVIPGIVIMLGLALTNEVIIIERIGIIAAMKRSWKLAEKQRGFIFGVLMIFGIISVIIILPVAGIFNTVILRGVQDPDSYLFTNTIINTTIGAVIEPFSVCGLILLYYNLRITKEGFDLEQLAKHFGSKVNTDEV